MNKIYPAIFHAAEEGGFWVSFPDLEGCFTEGETMEEAFEKAKEVLALHIDDLKELPPVTKMQDIKTGEGETVMLVEADDADDIVYIKTSDVPKYIENGLEEKGLTKSQAAFILDVDRSYFTHIENGKRIPSVDMAKRIALLLGFDWKIFFPNGERV